MFKDFWLTLSVLFLILLSVFILGSIAPALFPSYIIYLLIGVLAFWFFSQVDFEVVSLFSNHFYYISLFLLILTLVIGSVTRGTIRWIPIGTLNFQPAELVRPFLLVFFANYLTGSKVNAKKAVLSIGLLAIPAILILVQPSLGVSILTIIGFLGVVLATNFNKKYILLAILAILVLLPVFWKIMAPYQRDRITSFLNPAGDPLGSGYNSLQSTIAAGSGKFLGKGLGRGIQTQLSFLPEKQTDFIFASVAEELGLVGAGLMVFATFIILFRLTVFMESAVSPAARAYISGFFLTYLMQVFVHAGMNLGILPVTGLPFPLVSAGGSSFLATMIGLGIALGAYKR